MTEPTETRDSLGGPLELAQYVAVRGMITRHAAAAFAAGFLAFGMGIEEYTTLVAVYRLEFEPLYLAGMLLVAAAGMALVLPRAGTMAFMGFAILSVGACHVLADVFVARVQGTGLPPFSLFAALMLVWGAWTAARSATLSKEIPATARGRAARVWKLAESIRGGQALGERIVFRIVGLVWMTFYARLTEAALLVSEWGKAYVFSIAKAQVDLEVLKRRRFSGKVYADLRLGGRVYSIVISEDACERILAWKNPDEVAQAEPAPEPQA